MIGLAHVATVSFLASRAAPSLQFFFALGGGISLARASYTSGSYIYWMPVESLFESTRRAHYTWKRAARRFVLDPVRSDAYDDEIEGLFHDAEEQFLRHHVGELALLAARATDGQRAWLRHFLDAVPDGPERRAVMENLR